MYYILRIFVIGFLSKYISFFINLNIDIALAGFLLMLALAGLALGFILGGFFVSLYTEFDTLDANK